MARELQHYCASGQRLSLCADDDEDDDDPCADEMWVLAIASKGQEGRRRRGGLAAGDVKC